MPYTSIKQERYFNANRKELEAKGVNVAEFNAASKGKKLPMKAPKIKRMAKGGSPKNDSPIYVTKEGVHYQVTYDDKGNEVWQKPDLSGVKDPKGGSVQMEKQSKYDAGTYVPAGLSLRNPSGLNAGIGKKFAGILAPTVDVNGQVGVNSNMLALGFDANAGIQPKFILGKNKKLAVLPSASLGLKGFTGAGDYETKRNPVTNQFETSQVTGKDISPYVKAGLTVKDNRNGHGLGVYGGVDKNLKTGKTGYQGGLTAAISDALGIGENGEIHIGGSNEGFDAGVKYTFPLGSNKPPVPRFNKGGSPMKAPKYKKNKYADGGSVMDLSMLSDVQKTALDAVTDPAMKASLFQQFIGGIEKLKTIAPTAVDATQTAMDAKTSMSGGVDDVKKPSGVTNAGIGVAADIAGRAIVNGGNSDATTAGAAGVLKGVSEGAAFGPWGMAAGALLEGIPAVIGANKAKRDLKIKNNNSAMADALANQDTPNYTGKSLRSGGAPIPIRVQGGNKKIAELSDGGSVNGAGTAKSDSIKAKIDSTGFIVPAENSSAAEVLRATYLGAPDKKAKLKNGGAGKTDVKLSDGEHYFTAAETALLTAKGINLNLLAPNANAGNKLAAGGTPDKTNFIKDLFAQLGITPTEANTKAVKIWMAAEGSKATNNPLATTWKKIQSTDFNKAKVQNYKSYEDGVSAIAKTIKKNHPQILDSLQNGKDTNEILKVVGESKWGTQPISIESAKKSAAINDYAEKLRQNGIPEEKVKNFIANGYKQLPYDNYDRSPENQLQTNYNAWLKQYNRDNSKPVTTDLSVNGNFKSLEDQGYTDAQAAEMRNRTETKPDEDESGGTTGKTPGTQFEYPVDAPVDRGIKVTKGKTQQEEYAVTQRKWPDSLSPATEVPDVSNPTETVTAKKGVNAGTVLAGAQTALGIANLVGAGKRPVDKIDPNLLNSEQEAIQEANYGLTPAENAKVSADLELNRRTTAAQVLAAGGGDQASAFSGLTEGQQVKNRGVIDLGIANQREMARKKVYRDSLITEVANKKRQLFEDNMNAFEQNQGASADLMNAGLGNLFGSLKSEKI